MTEINHCLLCKNPKASEFAWFCSENCMDKFANKIINSWK